MAKKKSKLKTPDWIKEGYDSKEDWEKSKGITEENKGKKYKVKKCPECGGSEVKIVLSNLDSEEATSTGKEWECKQCNWKGQKPKVEEMSEDEFLEYLDKMEGK